MFRGKSQCTTKVNLQSSSSTTDSIDNDLGETEDDKMENSEAETSSATKRKGKKGAHGGKQQKRKMEA